MHYKQGNSREQTVLFPETLDDYISKDNSVRFIEAFVARLDLIKLGFRNSILNSTGRPPYHPSLLVKLYIYGYLHRIRSSRRLESECHRNVELMWLLEKLAPDHKTISDFRKNNKKALRGVCVEFTLLCKRLDLFGCELIAIDGSKFKAVNSKDKNYKRSHLEKLLLQIEQHIEEYYQILKETDKEESVIGNSNAEELKKKIELFRKDENKYRALLEELEKSGNNQISLTDEDSRLMRLKNDRQAVSYNAQIAVDDKYHLICANDVTNECTDIYQLSPMAKCAKDALDVEELSVIADTGYHNNSEIKSCVDAKITPYVSGPKMSPNEKKGLYSKSDFIYDAEADCYWCPAGEKLPLRFEYQHGKLRYHGYESSVCSKCKIRKKCTERKKKSRRIGRWEHEYIIDEMKNRMESSPEMMVKRRCLVEHPFGTLKHWWNQYSFLTKGLENVKTEFSMSVMAYNIKRTIKIKGVHNLIIGLE